MVGKTATVSTAVTEKNTAKAVGSGSLNVFSTPMMIALMEQAACESIAGGLEEGQTSVGTQISVEHTAPSPLGAEITATATVESAEGRIIKFSLTANDVTGKTEIGKGTHTRAVINAEKFMAKLAARPSV
jgi:predicted thioesterase